MRKIERKKIERKIGGDEIVIDGWEKWLGDENRDGEGGGLVVYLSSS